MANTLDPLVSTKLRPSQTRSSLVARPRLFEALARERGRRLTLVCAPAGFGKTTILSSWAQTRAAAGHPVVWLSLDLTERDPARFVTYLVAAIRRSVQPTFGEGILAAVHAPSPPRPEALAAILINELASLPGEIDVILDDYHLVDVDAINEVVGRLLDYLPPGLHLIVAGRTRPSLALARLRARAQMTELTASDLAFTQDEVAAFLWEVMRLDLPIESVTAIAAMTEGWVAGLQLAALSMRSSSDPARFVTSFSGQHRDVFDFLAEEVLAGQPDNIRQFLLETSILSTLSGPLCDAVTGGTGGQETLEELERSNLFIVALDDERRWFRYHHLFAEFLRDHLGANDPERVRELHLRAMRWYERNGHLADAIGHALAAPDHEAAVTMIERESRDAWSRGEIPTVLGWLEALPIELKRRRPRLLLQQAMALALTGRPDAVEHHLGVVDLDVEVRSEERSFLLGFAAAIRSWCARLQGDTQAAVRLAREALSLLPAEQGGLRAFAAVCLGDTLWTSGDLPAAEEALAEAAGIGRDASHVYSTISAMTLLARVQAERGRLRAARETLRHATRIVSEHNAELLPAAGAIHIGLGALEYERDQRDEAERALARGIELAERTRNVTDLVWGTVVMARVRWSRGDEEGAMALAHHADQVARDYGADLEIAVAAACLNRLHVLRGDIVAAAASVSSRESASVGAAAASMLDRIAGARLLHAQRRHDEALRLLDESRREAEANGRVRDLIEVLSLAALTRQAMGEPERARDLLSIALSMAATEGFVRIFLDEGPPMADLLKAMVTAGPGEAARSEAEYARQLLARMNRDGAEASTSSPALSESLTDREEEILRLITDGLSNREVAARTFVTVGTVKTHINNLYRKLGVHSRTQAIARARELGLL